MQVQVAPHGRLAVWTLIDDSQLFQVPLPQLRACVDRLDDQPLVGKLITGVRPFHLLPPCEAFTTERPAVTLIAL